MDDSTRGIDPVEYGPDHPAHWTTFDAERRSPSLALVEAVAETKGVDPVALDPIGGVIDADALDALLQSGSDDGSVLVNPYDPPATADAIADALAFSAREREQRRELAGHGPKRLALLGLGALESVESGRRIQHDQLDLLRELAGVGDRLALLVEVVCLRDDDPIREPLGVASVRKLPEAIDRQPFGVDVEGAVPGRSDFDRGAQRDVGLSRGGRAVHLSDRPTFEAAP
jgi:hypothetical protein